MAQLYHTSVQNVGQIIRRILDDGEVTQATINSAERYSEFEQRRRDEEAERQCWRSGTTCAR